MGFDMQEFLGGFDKEFSNALKNTELEGPNAHPEIPPGKYHVQVVGMAWKELRAKVPDGFSGMGMSLRLRVLAPVDGAGSSDHAGWYETPVYWILRKWPARGIDETQLNTATLELFAKMMKRCGYRCPTESLNELRGWTEPVGDSIQIQIKREQKGDREYRNIYLNYSSTVEGTFAAEKWDTFTESWVAPPSSSDLEDIPF